MRIVNIILGTVSAAAVLTTGVLLFPSLFLDRVTAPTDVLGHELLGLSQADVPALLQQVSREIAHWKIPLEFRGQRREVTFEELGIRLDVPGTVLALRVRERYPRFVLDQARAKGVAAERFQNVIVSPKNASLTIARGGSIQLVKSQPGEIVDSVTLVSSLHEYVTGAQDVVALRIIAARPRVEDGEVDQAKTLAQKLLEEGLSLRFEERNFGIDARQLRSLIGFGERVDPQQPDNYILGVRLHPQRLRGELEVVAEGLDREPVNATFAIEAEEGAEPRVTQFAAPERGLKLSVDASAERIAQAIAREEVTVPLQVDITEPDVTAKEDLVALGIRQVLAVGESDFVGSPRNRIHNITVGAARYHGLLIPPGEDFSFNEHLGPVTGAAGFKPELVIKKNVTTPEFGGGLCQVSTTAFRAALKAGLKITARRSHAYAVRYYGTPGFDATIYPGYSDLRFQNNTPGHILVQTKIEGTRLAFEFWGTPDGRTVDIDGPHPYNRQASGAVKATLTQRVFKDGQTIIDETFHSNYRSPALFPHT